MSSSTDRPTFIIVPGAWQTPWHYHLLTESLQNLGYRVVCLANPSIHKEGPWPETWEDDMENVASAIRKEANEGHEVVVVMHSYGGAPGSEGCKGLLVEERKAAGLRGGVSKLVYISAFVFPEGGELPGVVSQSPTMVIHDNGSVSHADPTPLLYDDVQEPLRSQAAANVVPMSQKVLALKTSFAPWKHVPAHYILCENDASMPLAMQKMHSSMEGGKWSTSSVKTGHSPFLVYPDAVASTIVDFALGKE